MTTFCRIIVKGKAQDVGFRGRIEYFGRGFDLRGQVQNEVNGNVKILCGGKDDIIEDFIQVISKIIGNNGSKIKAEIENIIKNDIEKERLSLDLYYNLPYPFGKVHTEDDEDLGRKLDKANSFLGVMPDIKNDTSDIKDILISMNGTMVSMNNKLISMDNTMRSIGDSLKKIAEK